MIPCIAHRTDGTKKLIRLPKPNSHAKDFLVEIGRKLHLRGENQMISIDTFEAAGYTHITDQNNKTIYPTHEKNHKKKIKVSGDTRQFRRPHFLSPYRPVAVALAQAKQHPIGRVAA